MSDINPESKFTFWVCVAFTLNYIVGSGFLTLPWAFQQTGSILGVAVLSLFAFYGILAVIFILETSERAKKLKSCSALRIWNGKSYQSINSATSFTHLKLASNDGQIDTPVTVDSDEEQSRSPSLEYIPLSISCDSIATVSTKPECTRKYECTELCELFLGTIGRQCYTAFSTFYMYGILWAYCTVFAKSFASRLPMTFLFGHHDLFVAQSYSYYGYLVVFGVLVVPVSLMEFHEQIVVQVSLTVFRVVMMLLMVGSIGVAYWSGGAQFSDTPVSSVHDPVNGMAMHWDKLYLLLPIVAYAFIFHHSVPSLAHPVQDKKSLVSIFAYALLISLVMYALVGTVVSSFFGSDLNTASNLNWETYVGVRKADGSVPFYAHLVAFFVVLFPALDVASAYPLNAYTLGNNMMGAYYGKDMHLHEKSRVKLSLFRALAAVPPLFGAMMINDLEKITKYTGLTGFAVMFIFPALLARCSSLKLKALGLDDETVHSGFFSSVGFQYLVGGSGAALLLIVGMCLLI